MLVECWSNQYDSPGQSDVDRSLGVVPERPPGGVPVEGPRVERGQCGATSGVGMDEIGARHALRSDGRNRQRQRPAASGELGPARRAAARRGWWRQVSKGVVTLRCASPCL
jgi:hypothetical protein